MPVKPEIYVKQLALARKYKSDKLLTNIEKQNVYVVAVDMTDMPCWECGKVFDRYLGHTEDYDPEHYDQNAEYFCPHCGIENIYCVPFVAIPNPWFWGNPRIYGNPKRDPKRVVPYDVDKYMGEVVKLMEKEAKK